MRVIIVDGYIDEPAALGVPPYIAPLPRYVAGAAADAGAEAVGYHTIDQLRGRDRGGPRGRDSRSRVLSLPGDGWDLLVLVGGAMVPGRYLRGRPASMRELAELARGFPGPTALVGPAARYAWTSGSAASREQLAAFDHVARGDGDASLHDLVGGAKVPRSRQRTLEEWSRWPVLGAKLARAHPDCPRPLIAEVETYRGCVRHAFGGCSFCTTVGDSPPLFRQPVEVVEEVAALADAGVVAFRLGGQSCVYSYMAKDVGGSETPRPSPRAVEALLDGVRRAAPGLEVLHVDNANPAVIAEHPEEAREVTRLLVDRCTGGNVVALGLEAADPVVRDANNLNSTPEQCMEAIRSINREGASVSPTGLPHLLPGVNFLAGLRGETEETFELNLRFLRAVMDEGLLLRRINIRQVAPVMEGFDTRRHRTAFRRFRDRVRMEVDRPLLRSMLPFGSPLRRVYTEVLDGGTTFCRQVGSYPLTVGIPALLDLGTFIDVSVVDHGYRSVTAVPNPLPVNDCPMSLLTAIPGVGRKRAARLARARPITSPGDVETAVDDPKVAARLVELIKF